MPKKAANGFDANSRRVINVGTPTAATDAASKGYVDAAIHVDAFPLSSRVFWEACDCMHPAANAYENGFIYTNSGTGAGWSSTSSDVNVVGIARGTLGTTATGRVSIASTNVSALRFGIGIARFAAAIKLANLSDATNAFTARLGFIDSVTAETNDGAFFRYTHSVNGGKWQAVTRSAGVETATDTGVAATSFFWDKLEIEVNAAGTTCVFKIDGAIVATNTTNIPTGSGRDTGYGLMVLRSAGTAGLAVIDVDFLEVQHVFTTPR